MDPSDVSTFCRIWISIDELTKAVQNEKPLLLVPLVRNVAAVDSTIYDPKEVLTCIQITTNREHDVPVSGLQTPAYSKLAQA